MKKDYWLLILGAMTAYVFMFSFYTGDLIYKILLWILAFLLIMLPDIIKEIKGNHK